MALTPSTMFPLNNTAPDFNLLDVNTNKKVSLNELSGAAGTLIVFMCNHCPFVIHLLGHFTELASELKENALIILFFLHISKIFSLLFKSILKNLVTFFFLIGLSFKSNP